LVPVTKIVFDNLQIESRGYAIRQVNTPIIVNH
jgi:hypothetical protein